MITHEEARTIVKDNFNVIRINYPDIQSKKSILEEETKLNDYISQQEKKDELLGLFQDLFKKLELTVEHDTTDTWAGCVEYNYVEINGGITDEVETVEKIQKLQKELGEMK